LQAHKIKLSGALRRYKTLPISLVHYLILFIHVAGPQQVSSAHHQQESCKYLADELAKHDSN